MNIPSSIISDLLLESPTFRKFAAQLLSGVDVVAFRKRVENLINTFHSNEKIAAIKAVRTLSSECPEEFSETFNVPCLCSSGYPKGVVGLADAKHIVESNPRFSV
jgi:hypothetical protein